MYFLVLSVCTFIKAQNLPLRTPLDSQSGPILAPYMLFINVRGTIGLGGGGDPFYKRKVTINSDYCKFVWPCKLLNSCETMRNVPTWKTLNFNCWWCLASKRLREVCQNSRTVKFKTVKEMQQPS